jgi:aryl-alcohol dehydrogenase-like predicted oxidoreductase
VGKSGLYISKLSLGTMTLGEAESSSVFHGIGCAKEEAFRIMDLAIDQGINCFDTANIYGGQGMVEKLMGDYFSARKNRSNLVVATKFRFSMGDSPHEHGGSRKHIMDAVEASLTRLKTDYIDLYQIHMQDINTPEEETLRALDDLTRQGKIRYFGASNYAAYRFLDALHESDKLHLNRYCALQMQYSLLCRDIEREHVPLCLKHDVGILAWSPLAGGFLSGKYMPGQAPANTRFSVRKDWGARFMNDRSFNAVEKLKTIAGNLEVSPSQVALAWLMKKPKVSSVIIGARSTTQLMDNIKSLEVKLNDEHMNYLEEASALPKLYPYNFIASEQGRW